ncbi:tRNA 2-thiocytidine biosynthesis TtcA family protein [Chlamydiifrater volucris]|uniref:tRNA 2-thiocytidine biosynthesis TtcA family protein n=1 Tax=Chlamydiifrater volucris TaxID=2681470 RepID=UPI001BCF23FF|nr:tRNA 2-thiocytidine biosynthesis TtcA family protein [Chlamydiifrater volucris]
MFILPSPVFSPPWPKVGKRIESAVRKAIYTYDMLSKTRIVVALSGGKDSLTMLMMLKAISGKGFPELDIHAITIEGKYSCGAEVGGKYLENICQKLSVPLQRLTSPYTPDVPECYSCSQVRRRMLFKAAQELGASVVAFGHHKNDDAQTVLMNLLHKAEFGGLAPVLEMVRFGITIIRPLIFVSEKDIRRFAKECGFMRITCRCPVISLRKKAEDTLRLIEEVFPLARHNLALASRSRDGYQKPKNNLFNSSTGH